MKFLSMILPDDLIASVICAQFWYNNIEDYPIFRHSLTQKNSGMTWTKPEKKTRHSLDATKFISKHSKIAQKSL